MWALIKSAVRAHAMAEGKSGSSARPATQACRAAGACAAKEGDVELAADVLAVVTSAGPDDEITNDASVVASCAAAFAVSGDVTKAAETLRRNADGDALASALAAICAAGAGGSVLATLSDAACLGACGGVTEGTCAAVVACVSEGRGGERGTPRRSSFSARGARRTRAPPPRRRGWRRGAREQGSKASSSPATPPGARERRGDPAAREPRNPRGVRRW